MNEKIPLRKFAEQVASNASISVDEAEADIRQLFTVIITELRTGQPVTVKGLGEFSLTSDAENPVMFTPDSYWADEVNAPFAMFEPVDVNPEISNEELESVVVEKPITAPTPSEIEDGADAMIKVETEMSEAYAEESDEPTNNNELKVNSKEKSFIPESPTEPAKPVTASKTTMEINRHKVAPYSAAETNTVRPFMPVTHLWPEEEEELAEREMNEAKNAGKGFDREEIYDREGVSHRSGFGCGFLFGLIFGLAIGALALFAYVSWYVNNDTGQVTTDDVKTELTIDDPDSQF